MRRMSVFDPLASSRAGRARIPAVVIMLATASAIVAASMFSAIHDASALGPKGVRGYIFDQLGSPISGANVTVKMIHGVSTIATEWYDASEIDGIYTVVFDPFLGWVVGDTIEVTASYLSHQSTSSVSADAEPVQYVNVTIAGIVVPEFGALSLAMVCGAFVAVFILIGRRRAGS
jgi:hypothetical protein